MRATEAAGLAAHLAYPCECKPAPLTEEQSLYSSIMQGGDESRVIDRQDEIHDCPAWQTRRLRRLIIATTGGKHDHQHENSGACAEKHECAHRKTPTRRDRSRAISMAVWRLKAA
jgi:hypothetical protein